MRSLSEKEGMRKYFKVVPKQNGSGGTDKPYDREMAS
jgi:hypothetical protein